MPLPSFATNFLPPGDGQDAFRRLVRYLMLLSEKLVDGCAAELAAATLIADFYGDGFNSEWDDICDYLIVYLDSGDVYMAFNKSERNDMGFVPAWTLMFAASGGGANILPGTSQARLSLSSSDAAHVTDQLAATTLYFLPYKGNEVALYNGSSAWDLFPLAASGINIAIPATTDTNYDVFVTNSGGLTLELVAWTDDTTRATAIVLQDGVYVKSGETTKLYLGSIRTTAASGQCEKSSLFCNVENYFNKLPWRMQFQEVTNSWAYTSTTVRAMNNSTANRLSFIIGVSEQALEATYNAHARTTSNGLFYAPIGLDSTSAKAADSIGGKGAISGSGPVFAAIARYSGYPGIGYHYLQALESGNTGVTFTGDDGTTLYISGMQGVIWA